MAIYLLILQKFEDSGEHFMGLYVLCVGFFNNRMAKLGNEIAP